MNTPDILIYVHPEFSPVERVKVEHEVMGCPGVISAGFDQHDHPHALMVVYDSDAITGKQILATVRRFDPAATMIGL